MVSLIHSCFSRSDEQISLPHLHSLAWSFLIPNTPALLQTSLSLKDHSIISQWTPCLSSSHLLSKIPLPEKSSSNRDFPYHFQLEIFQWLLLAPAWSPASWHVRGARQPSRLLVAMNKAKPNFSHSGTVEPPK